MLANEIWHIRDRHSCNSGNQELGNDLIALQVVHELLAGHKAVEIDGRGGFKPGLRSHAHTCAHTRERESKNEYEKSLS